MKKEIGEYIKILSGYPFNSDLFNEENIGKPLIRIRDLERSYSKTYFNGEYEKTYVISQGDILVGMDGDFNAVKWKGIDSLLNQRICKIETEENSLDKEFMYQSLQSELNKIHRKTAATTVKHLSTKDIKKIKIFFPLLEEQKKIADILSTVDKKIAFVEENINATEELKKGLMQKLLTEGIGHTDFKDSELGRIPESWDIKEIQESTDYVDYRGKTPTKTKNGIFLVTARNIKNNKIDYSLSEEFVSIEDYDNVMSRGLPKIGDILLTTEAPLGEIAMVDREDIALAQRIIKYRGKENILDNGYLKYCFLSSYFQKLLDLNSTGSTVKGIKGSRLKKLNILIPPLEEQKQIAEILSTVDKKLENLKEKKQYFEELKKGLMQKLLTGEVRL